MICSALGNLEALLLSRIEGKKLKKSVKGAYLCNLRNVSDEGLA